jgi:predicted Zn-dependent protease
MGFLEFRAGHVDVARKWYEQAVKLDSQSYIAHYYYAAISINAGAGPEDDAQVENSLRAAIKLNPSFAPALNTLAAFEGMRHRNLEEAHMMALTATQLDPGNVGYRLTGANVLMEMDRGTDAVAVLRGALKVAKSPEETAMIQNSLMRAEEYTAARQQAAEQTSRMADVQKTRAQANAEFSGEGITSSEAAEEEVPKGSHRFLSGILQNVQCHAQKMDLTIAVKGKTTPLHSGNYYKIGFTALGFTPKGDLNPCEDLEGKSAKVEYVESSAQSTAPYVVAIELHK